jgi:ER degradation enhancer, mannosidase alpha-like 2
MGRLSGLVILLAISLAGRSTAQPSGAAADSVKTEFLHAWNGYKEYAWGHDALMPLSKQPHDWYGVSFCMTPVDAFDTMVLMGLEHEAAEAKQLILDSLSFDRNVEVQAFEVTIRLLGGLLSAYELDGNPRFLALAEDLGQRLLPIYGSGTGMPYRYVNLQTGAIRDSLNNPAEIGTALLEFGTLSRLTGKSVYYDRAKNALSQLYRRRSAIGLVGSVINVETGAWVNTTSHIGGGIDSYYEYLFKAWLLFGDNDCKAMWDQSIKAVNTYIPEMTRNGLWYGRVEMENGERSWRRFGALEAFFPAVLALSGDTVRARELWESCRTMWDLFGAAPELINFINMEIKSPGYELRPEVIESAYTLYRITGDDRYRRFGQVALQDLIRSCRTEAGYAALEDVTTKKKADRMESFFLAETMKYLYLLLAPPETLRFDSIVFTTEAHPLRRAPKE